MNRQFTQTDLESFMNTVEVVVPKTSQVRREFSEFIPMIISILAMLNMTMSALLGRDFIPLSNDEVYLIVSGVVSVASILWTAWKNTSFSLKDKQRKEVADQVFSKPDVQDIFK